MPPIPDLATCPRCHALFPVRPLARNAATAGAPVVCPSCGVRFVVPVLGASRSVVRTTQHAARVHRTRMRYRVIYALAWLCFAALVVLTLAAIWAAAR